jgi:hypothetical protein
MLGGPQVFFNGAPLTLARWPNINRTSGYWEWGSVASVQSPGPNAAFTVATAASASCSNPVSATQLAAWGVEDDLWAHGYWGFDWVCDPSTSPPSTEDRSKDAMLFDADNAGAPAAGGHLRQGRRGLWVAYDNTTSRDL